MVEPARWGTEPRHKDAGKFNLLTSPEWQERMAIVAQAEGTSINALAQDSLQGRVAARIAAASRLA